MIDNSNADIMMERVRQHEWHPDNNDTEGGVISNTIIIGGGRGVADDDDGMMMVWVHQHEYGDGGT